MFTTPTPTTITFGLTAILLVVVFLFSIYFIIHTAIIDSIREIFTNIQKTNVAGQIGQMIGGLPISIHP